jgi:hypothetical protein
MATLHKINKKRGGRGKERHNTNKYVRSRKRRGEREKRAAKLLMSNVSVSPSIIKNPKPPSKAKSQVVPAAHRHSLRSKDPSITPTVHEAPPNPQTNLMYSEYISLMDIQISANLGCRFLPNDCYRPSIVPSLEEIKKRRYPKWVQDKMDAGVVMECQLHKIVFTTSVKSIASTTQKNIPCQSECHLHISRVY